MLRAVTYARVSGDDRGNEGRNLAGQLEMCRDYAARRGYQIVEELAEDDRGASGASFELEQLSKVLDMASDHQFDILVVREIDRLSRNLAKQLIIEEELRRAGVQIEYVLGEYPDTPEGTLMKHIRAVVAEYEREKIRERIERGKRLKVRSGSVMTNGINRPPYGYDVVKNENKWMLEVFEPEAKIVRLIFQWYVYGDENGRLTIRGITSQLTALGVPTRFDSGRQTGGYKLRKKGEWSEGQVGKILGSEVYCGLWHYGKRGANGKGQGKEKIAVNVPAIIDQETWMLAEKRRERNRIDAKRNKKWVYLLSGRAKCGHCGQTVIGEVNRGEKLRFYYRCKATHKGQIANVECHSPTFPLEKMDALVWNWLVELLGNPAKLADGLAARVSESDKQVAPLRERLSIVDDLLEDNRTKLERLIELYVSGDFSKDDLVDRKKRLETSIKSLNSEKQRLTETVNQTAITPEQIQSVYSFAEKINKGLKIAQDDPNTKREILDALDLKAIFSAENGEKSVFVECVLGSEKLGLAPITTLKNWDQNFWDSCRT